MTDVLVVTEESAITVEAVLTTVLEVPAELQTLIDPSVTSEVLVEAGVSEVLETPPEIITLVELVAGPQGAPGVSEGDMKYSKKVDFITDDLFYKGEAAPGSSLADPAWRVSRTAIGPDGDVTEEWANGSAAFAHVWADRLTYTYS